MGGISGNLTYMTIYYCNITVIDSVVIVILRWPLLVILAWCTMREQKMKEFYEEKDTACKNLQMYNTPLAMQYQPCFLRYPFCSDRLTCRADNATFSNCEEDVWYLFIAEIEYDRYILCRYYLLSV